jgi:hypothetical protein
MNVIEAIASLRHDLDRTIESLELLRNGFSSYALIAEDLDKPRHEIQPRVPGERLKGFLEEYCHIEASSWVRTSALWTAYKRWCRLHADGGIGPVQFHARMLAQGFILSRSRRIRGKQSRTWEGIGLRTVRKPVVN